MPDLDDDFHPVTGGVDLPNDQVRDDLRALRDQTVGSDLDKHIVRLFALHPRLRSRFGTVELASLGTDAKQSLLDDMNAAFGVRALGVVIGLGLPMSLDPFDEIARVAAEDGERKLRRNLEANARIVRRERRIRRGLRIAVLVLFVSASLLLVFGKSDLAIASGFASLLLCLIAGAVLFWMGGLVPSARLRGALSEREKRLIDD